jgi:hypothetical protein
MQMCWTATLVYVGCVLDRVILFTLLSVAESADMSEQLQGIEVVLIELLADMSIAEKDVALEPE